MFLKSKILTFPTVRYFKQKPEFFSNILQMVVSGKKICFKLAHESLKTDFPGNFGN